MLHVTLGNKNYSSWSLRAWLLLEHLGLPFEEQVIPLDQPDSKARLLAISPSGLVPVLRDGERVIWDSLAIAEYLAEKHPQAQLWPADEGLRTLARSATCEMHGGFVALRTHMPMDIRASYPGKGRGPGVQENIERIQALWAHCLAARDAAGAPGDFLLGRFGIVDAAFAPVAMRFATYGVELGERAQRYAQTLQAMPVLARWRQAAQAEPWSIDVDLV